MSTALAPTAPTGLLFCVPLIGTMIKDALFGFPDAKYYFAANVVILWLWAVILVGYPVVIVTALTATAAMLSFLVYFTSLDLVAQARSGRGGKAG